MAKILGIDHISILVSNAQLATDFYRRILGVETVARPSLGFPGSWLDLGNGQTLHLLQVNNPYAGVERPTHGGRDMHFALKVDNIMDFITKLGHLGVEHTKSSSGRRAVFFRDLDQNTVELYEA